MGGDHVHCSNRPTDNAKFVVACAIFASLNTVLVGYDVGVMSGAVLFIQEDLRITEVEEEILVGCLSIVSLFWSLGGKASDAIGRKWAMGFAAIVFQTGFGVMVAPVYIAEISPTVTRGSLTSYPEIFINLGILLGYVSNYAFAGLPVHLNWRVMLAAGILPSLFIGIALFIIPESPRWLVDERLAEIQAAAGEAKLEGKSERAVWGELFSPLPPLRRMLITGIGIHCFQQITGIEATVYYSPEIFSEAGIKSKSRLLAATVAVGFTKTVAIFVAITLIDKLGRKPLLYVSTIGMTACLLRLVLSLAFLKHGQAAVGFAILFVCGNVAFFSVGIGPICWVLTSEIFPLRLRAQASSLGVIGNRLSSGLVAMSFLSVSRSITVAGTFFIFSIFSALSILFVHKAVPETKGKSLEQIELMFDKAEGLRSEVELGDLEHLVHIDN
ncbi:hypothetical protein Syun_008381 [Stephania yunnanensis]|uniref:Major facilitator superfamily (MFS) profile domain-containing protein n=1 Tax=Stephania yunnanensis TaxID=152371 RepID=A0AAP0KCP7_9MAGN